MYRCVITGGSFGWQPWESGVQDSEKREKGKSQGSSLDFRRADFSMILLGKIWKALDGRGIKESQLIFRNNLLQV